MVDIDLWIRQYYRNSLVMDKAANKSSRNFGCAEKGKIIPSTVDTRITSHGIANFSHSEVLAVAGTASDISHNEV